MLSPGSALCLFSKLSSLTNTGSIAYSHTVPSVVQPALEDTSQVTAVRDVIIS